MSSRVLLGLGIAGVLGAGVWLGRATSSSSSSSPARAPEVAAAPRTATLPEPRVAPPARTPALPVKPAARLAGLDADLADTDPKVRRAAIKELAADPSADVRVLSTAARDADLVVGVNATDALGKRYAAGDVPLGELAAIANDRALDDRVRVTALNAIGLVAAPEAATLLVDLLARGSTLERGTAAILLVHQDAAVAVPALIRALGDADAVVRDNALEALRGRSRGRDFGTDAAAWSAWWATRTR